MATTDRRAAARRKAWGRGPMILRFEPLEGRQLLSSAGDAPDAPNDSTATSIVSANQEGHPYGEDGVVITSDPGSPVDESAQSGPSVPDSKVELTSTNGNGNGNLTGAPSPLGRPDLTLDAFGTLPTLDWGQPFRAQGRVRNVGTAAAPAGVKVDVYASTTPVFGPGAVFVGTATVDQAIPAGAAGEFDASVIAPPLPLPGLGNAPSYYVLARVDADGVVAESNEANNGGGPADPSSVVTITPKVLAQLEATAFLVSPSVTTWGKSIEIAAQITNIVPGTVAPPTRARIVLSPKNQPATSPGAVTIGELSVPQLTSYPPADLKATIKLPETPPAWLAGSSTFTVSILPDADFLTATPLSLFLGHGSGRESARLTILPGPAPLPPGAKPDLSIVRLQPVTDTATWGQPFQVRTTVENDGTADSGQLRVRFVLLDANRPNAAPLAMADAVLDSLPAGYKQDILQTIPLQGPLPPGIDPSTIAARVLVQVDPENRVDEANESNNGLLSASVKFRLLTKDGTRTDVPTPPGQVTTPTSTPTPPPTGTPTPTPSATPDNPQPRPGGRRWRLHQAHQANRPKRPAKAPAKRPLSLRLRVNRPGLKLVNGGRVRTQLADRGHPTGA